MNLKTAEPSCGSVHELRFTASAEVSPRSSGPVQAAHSVQVSECRAPPSAQGPPLGHTRSVGGQCVVVRGTCRVEVSWMRGVGEGPPN